VLNRAGRLVEAAPMILKAMELYEEGTEAWAEAAGATFFALMSPDCDGATKPEWWTDEALKALSVRVVAAAPHQHMPCGMRGRVLEGSALSMAPWNVGPRTAAEIKEAATLHRRAQLLTRSSAEKRACEQRASQCDDFADPLLAEAEAEAAKARAAAEAEAEKARAAAEAEAAKALKVAEAKATAAAEELLAEEEKEKQQAANKTASKAKGGKGKKGTGRR